MHATPTFIKHSILQLLKRILEKSNDSNSTGLALLGQFGDVFQL